MADIGTLYHGSLTIEDGTSGTALDYTLDYSVGDLSLENIRDTQRETVPIQIRGSFVDLALGDAVAIQGSFTCKLKMTDYTNSAAEAALDFFRRKESFSAAVSDYASGAEVFTSKLTWAVTRNSVVQTLVLTNCDYTASIQEQADGNVLSLSFVCYGTLTITKS